MMGCALWNQVKQIHTRWSVLQAQVSVCGAQPVVFWQSTQTAVRQCCLHVGSRIHAWQNPTDRRAETLSERKLSLLE